jgi:hypothetical protein
MGFKYDEVKYEKFDAYGDIRKYGKYEVRTSNERYHMNNILVKDGYVLSRKTSKKHLTDARAKAWIKEWESHTRRVLKQLDMQLHLTKCKLVEVADLLNK